MEIKQFTAMKAFVFCDGKLLLLRESTKYKDGTKENLAKFDVVGGRVKSGEHFMKSLLREIKEETGLDVEVKRPFFVNEWKPFVRDEQWHIIGTFFICEAKSNRVILSEDHDAFEWIDPRNFEKYNIIPNLKEAFKSYLSL